MGGQWIKTTVKFDFISKPAFNIREVFGNFVIFYRKYKLVCVFSVGFKIKNKINSIIKLVVV